MNKTKVILISKRLQQTKKARHTHREAGSRAMDGKLRSIHGAWIPAQIRLERICIYPKGFGQDSPE